MRCHRELRRLNVLQCVSQTIKCGIVSVLGKVKGGVCRVQSALERIRKVGEAEDKNCKKVLKKWSPRRKWGRTVMHMRLPSDELDKITPFRKFEQCLDTDVDMVERPLLSTRSMGENMPFDSPMALDGEGPFADVQPPSVMSINFGNDMNMPLTPLQRYPWGFPALPVPLPTSTHTCTQGSGFRRVRGAGFEKPRVM